MKREENKSSIEVQLSLYRGALSARSRYHNEIKRSRPLPESRGTLYSRSYTPTLINRGAMAPRRAGSEIVEGRLCRGAGSLRGERDPETG